MALASPILSMFARSPIRPLEKHIDKVHTVATTLLPFFDAVLANHWEQARQLQEEITVLVNEADALKKELRLHLPKSIFLPVSRSDVLALLSLQDNLVNKAKDIAGIIVGREMHIPDAIAPNFLEFLKRSVDASAQACQAINELDELLEAGFRGSEVALVENMILKLDEIEHDTDNMQIVIRRQIFELEDSISPIKIMFLYKVIEHTGDLANCAQSIGGHLHILLAR